MIADKSPLPESLAITYNILIFPIAKMKKDDPKKRKGTNPYLKLSSSEPLTPSRLRFFRKSMSKPSQRIFHTYR